MKVLFLVSCALAVAHATWQQPNQHGYQNEHHVPVIQNGVPVETPEVQRAKSAHLQALAEASSRAGHQGGAEDNGQYNPIYHGDNGQYNQAANQQARGFSSNAYPYNQPQQYNQYNNGAYNPNPYQASYPANAPSYQPNPAPYHSNQANQQGSVAYQTSNVVPSIRPDGTPLDTPEVEAAKAHHFSLVNQALQATSPHGPQQHYRKRRGIYSIYPQHLPTIGPNGVPVEPIEVQQARAEHLKAHGIVSYPSYAYAGVNHDGLPLDTPEVAHAKAAHFAAYNEAAARNQVHPAAYNYLGYNVYNNGAPIDTPEVQQAKAAHFAAHAAASAHHY